MYKNFIRQLFYFSAFCLFFSSYGAAQIINKKDHTNNITVIEPKLTKFNPLEFVQTIKPQSLTAKYKQFNELKIGQSALSDIVQVAPSIFEMDFPISAHQVITFQLHKVKILTDDFKIGLNDKGDLKTPIDLGVHYQGFGEINGKKVICAFSFFKNKIEGVLDYEKISITSLKINEPGKAIMFRSADYIGEEPLGCGMLDDNNNHAPQDLSPSLETRETKCTEIWWESNFNVYTFQGSSVQNTIIFNLSLFNAYHQIYSNESVKVLLHHLEIWTSTSPYPDPSDPGVDDRDEVLNSFVAYRESSWTGDLAGLVTQLNIGGLAAGFSGLCNSDRSESMCISGLSGGGIGTYPNYAFNVYITCHEFGHLFGSRHTHACVWNGNSTAIDGCSGFTEGGCALPSSPSGGGTIMSYCWNSVGIDFTQGFGPQPGALIRNNVNAAPCLTSCCLAGFTPSIVTNTPLCEGGSLSLSASLSGNLYSWSGPAGFKSSSANPTIVGVTGANSGLYSLTITNSEGCIAVATKNITINPIPVATASASPNPVCQNKDLFLSATGGISYLWAGPGGWSATGSNPTIFNIQTAQAGLYSVTVTNAYGCTNVASTTVNVDAAPFVTIGASPNPVCEGSTLNLTSSGGTSFSWSGPAGFTSLIQNPIINNFQLYQAGIYSVTVSNSAGCTAIGAITVSANPKPTATVTPATQSVCTAKPIVPIVISSTFPGATFTWTRDQPGITGMPMSGSGSPISGTLINTGSTVVTVTFSITPTASGCIGDPVTAKVLVYPSPRAVATAEPNPVCEGELMWFRASGGVLYKWSGPNGFTWDGGSFGRHMALNMAGIYTVTVTSSAGCTSTATVNAQVLAGPNGATASVSPNPACSGSVVQFAASGGVSYKWSGPFGFSSTQQNPVINNIQQYHAGTYTVVVYNAAGCAKSISLELVVNQKPDGKISYDQKSTCEGGNLQLFASGGTTYSWSGPGGWTSSLQNPLRSNVNLSHSGIYTVVISNGPCSVTLSVTITIRSKPTVNAWTTTPEVCEGSTAYLFGSGAVSYSWDGPYSYHSNFQNPIIERIPVYMSGNYTLTGTNEYGCSATATVNITVRSLNGQIAATPNPVPLGGTLYLTSSGGENYQWTGPNGFHSNDQNPIIARFTKFNEGVYTVVISNKAGCQDTKMVSVTLRTFGGEQYIVVDELGGNYKQVYPNPTNAFIQINEDYTGNINFTILNSSGNKVLNGSTKSGQEIEINSLPSGVYFIQWNYLSHGKSNNYVSRFAKIN